MKIILDFVELGGVDELQGRGHFRRLFFGAVQLPPNLVESAAALLAFLFRFHICFTPFFLFLEASSFKIKTTKIKKKKKF
jgi:hypothetical protein